MVFSGIVEEIGAVRAASAGSLKIAAGVVLDQTALGESIAVNGACLTVAERGADWFRADVMPETLRRTNLGGLRAGDPVNLERALTLAARLGGHIVQGHIDGTGIVQAMLPEGDAVLVTIAAEPPLMRYVIEKGYIAVDGASLTVVDNTETAFRVSLVRYTLEHTIFGRWQVGQAVNLEIDILAKYVERLLPSGASPLSAVAGAVWTASPRLADSARREGL
ncbi:MAG TPA: riboflavin synthase [Chloroflexota bacterium]|jgi:riboflavin synthase|nr:riboflavin synthase [Chloroflexota bacterium]